ncbi:MAG: NosD domain-containing protein [archaeon]
MALNRKSISSFYSIIFFLLALLALVTAVYSADVEYYRVDLPGVDLGTPESSPESEVVWVPDPEPENNTTGLNESEINESNDSEVLAPESNELNAELELPQNIVQDLPPLPAGDQPGCINITDLNTSITVDTTLCGYTYYINDSFDTAEDSDSAVIWPGEGVTIDCDGSTFIGNGSGDVINPPVYVSNVKIKNCIFQNYNRTILFLGVNNITVENCTFINVTQAIKLTNTPSLYHTIANNTLINAGNISVSGSYSLVDSNNVTGGGIYIGCPSGTCTGSNITNNIVSDWSMFGAYGIKIASHTYSRVSNNTISNISGGFSGGVYTNSVTYLTIENNTLINGGYGGIYLYEGNNDHNNITLNNVTNSSVIGIFINGQYNLITNNTVRDAGSYGISFDTSDTNDYNDVYYNLIYGDTSNVNYKHMYSYAAEHNNFNTTSGATPHGNFYSDITGLSIFDIDQDGYGETGSQYPYNNTNGGWVYGYVNDWGPMGAVDTPYLVTTTIQGANTSIRDTNVNMTYTVLVRNAGYANNTFNLSAVNYNSSLWADVNQSNMSLNSGYSANITLTVGSNVTGDYYVDFLAVMANNSSMNSSVLTYTNVSANVLYCGDAVTKNVTLSEFYYNLTDCSGHGLNVTVSNAIIDCSGVTLTGDYGSSDYGIVMDGQTNVTIRNCSLDQFGVGIRIINSNFTLVYNNSFPTTTSNFIYTAISFTGTNYNNTVSNNTVLAYGEGTSISLGGFNNGTVSNNYVLGNNDPLDSTVALIGMSDSSYTTIVNNTMNNSYQRGISAGYPSNFNTIANNTIWSSGNYGLYVKGTNNTLSGNTITDGGSSGISIDSNAHGNIITNNTITSSSGNGIYILSADNCRVYDNVISGGSSSGIYISNAESNLVYDNSITGNARGVYIDINSPYNNVYQNNITGNSIVGVLLYYGDSTNIYDNNISSNSQGIEIGWDANSNNITRNTIYNNTVHGGINISSTNSYDNIIYQNNIWGNLEGGSPLNARSVNESNYFNNSIGGNYWGNFDSSEEGCNNTDFNAFCDAEYVIDDGSATCYDYAPYASMDAWSDVTAPQITITSPTNQSQLEYTTTWILINISTDEVARCKYNDSNSSFNFTTQGTNFTNTESTEHTFNYTGLTESTSYTIYYKCQDALGNVNSASAVHSLAVNMGPITDFNATLSPVDNSSINLSWSTKSSAGGYYLWYSTNVSWLLNTSNLNTSNIWLNLSGSSNTSYIDTNASQNSSRYYRVAAYQLNLCNFSAETVGKFNFTIVAANLSDVKMNLISMPLQIQDDNITSLILSAPSAGTTIAYYMANETSPQYGVYFYHNSTWKGTMNQLNNLKGFVVTNTQGFNFTVVGTVPTGEQNVTIYATNSTPGQAQVNTIGWYSAVRECGLNATLNETGMSSGDTLSWYNTTSKDFETITRDGAGWTGDFACLEPGKGYFVTASNTYNLSYIST